MNRWINRWTGGWKEEKIDRWMDRWMEGGCMNEWLLDKSINSKLILSEILKVNPFTY